MISLLKKVIKEHPEWLQSKEKDVKLSFMKFCTSASGLKNDKSKVQIFVFEKGQELPTLCVKTVRSYKANEVIKQNHENAKRLQKESDGTSHAKMFSKPLYFYDDGSATFCVESVCPGEKFSAKDRDIDFVIDKYSDWQKDLAKSANILHVDDVKKLVADTIQKLPLQPSQGLILQSHFDHYWLDPEIRLPVIVQHGDMTPDNVLIDEDQMYLIDYDYVGLSELPGFDLFHFLSKTKERRGSFHTRCSHYLPIYFQNIEAKVASFDALLFLYHLQESIRKGIGSKTGNEIIADFKAVLDRE